jgi:hypothetical protein
LGQLITDSSKYSVRAILGALFFAFRSTAWDDVIVDVHEKTTMIGFPIL